MAGYYPESKSELYETPPELFRAFDLVFDFNIDVACNSRNCLCEQGITENGRFLKKLSRSLRKDSGSGGLDLEWFAVNSEGDSFKGRAFCNPPYGASKIEEWLKKAALETLKKNAEIAAPLVPSSTETSRQWGPYVWEWRADFLIFIRNRVKFFLNGEPLPSSHPKGSVLIIYTENYLEIRDRIENHLSHIYRNIGWPVDLRRGLFPFSEDQSVRSLKQ